MDALRGLVMFLMLAEVLELHHVAEAKPGNLVWEWLARAQAHVEWTGCNLHDLIQPTFSFLVGTALAFSVSRRAGEGQSKARMWWHVVRRAIILVLLGVFLRSVGRTQTRWTFEDTLSQIGLGYPLLFWASGWRPKWQAVFCGGLLVAVWLLFAVWPLRIPGPQVGVPVGWDHLLSGFAGHWNMNANPAFAFDVWFLNLFARPKPFEYNGGGYATLSFLPTLGTMLLGLIAGRWLQESSGDNRRTIRGLAVWGAAGIAAGVVFDQTGICPVVKRIWTPSWVLFSGGWCAWMLAGFVWLADRPGGDRATAWVRTFGSNSIAAYVGSHLLSDLTRGALNTHLGPEVLEIFGKPYEPLVTGALMLLVWWAALRWMEKQRILIRV